MCFTLYILHTRGKGTISIQGTAKEGETLTVQGYELITDEDNDEGQKSVDTSTMSFQWMRDGNATTSDAGRQKTYTLTQADVGKNISVEVAYTDAFGEDEKLASDNATVQVENVNDAPQGRIK